MNQELRDLLQKIADNREDSVFITDAEATVARNALEPPVQLKPSEAASFSKTLARSPRRIEPASREASSSDYRAIHEDWQGETDYVWHQGCKCSRCRAEYERLVALQNAQKSTEVPK